MEIKIKPLTDWALVRELARFTVGKKNIKSPVTDEFKRAMLMSRHSCLRPLQFQLTLIGIPDACSTHIVRHKIGVEHFVTTQRPDRTGKARGGLRNHTLIINAEALVTQARRRLCDKASEKTRAIYNDIKEYFLTSDYPEIGHAMQPSCYWYGHCPELSQCEYPDLLTRHWLAHWRWLKEGGLDE